MYVLNHDLARVLMDERLAEMERVRRRRQARLTRPAAKRPEPARPTRTGLLAWLVPSFGARVHTA